MPDLSPNPLGGSVGPARSARPGPRDAPGGRSTTARRKDHMATQVGIRELLEAGVHFGHQTRRWNPKMRRFIFGERDGIYIIDLRKTQALLDQAQTFADSIARRGGTVLFVGTKKQARDSIKEVA